MSGWYLHIGTDFKSGDLRYSTGKCSMHPGIFRSKNSVMYVVSNPALARSLRALGYSKKSPENIKIAICSYYFGGV